MQSLGYHKEIMVKRNDIDLGRKLVPGHNKVWLHFFCLLTSLTSHVFLFPLWPTLEQSHKKAYMLPHLVLVRVSNHTSPFLYGNFPPESTLQPAKKKKQAVFFFVSNHIQTSFRGFPYSIRRVSLYVITYIKFSYLNGVYAASLVLTFKPILEWRSPSCSYNMAITLIKRKYPGPPWTVFMEAMPTHWLMP